MIHTLLPDDNDQLMLIAPDDTLSFAQVQARARQVAAALIHRAPDRVYLYGQDSAAVVLVILAASMAGVQVIVLNRHYTHAEVFQAIQQVGPGVILTDDETLDHDAARRFDSFFDALSHDHLPHTPLADDSEIVIFTTGTTGTPKAVRYTWSRLVAQARRISAGWRWLLAYPLNHFAGIQLLVHAVVNVETLVIPPSRGFDVVLTTIREQGVDAISATPTFWRVLTSRFETADAPPLKQITLGGEAATPDILYRLRRLFPGAVLTQVYATTEIGSCFSVKDGLPGFPLDYLARPVGNVALKVEDDQLYIRAAHAMDGYIGAEAPAVDDGWLPTGDRVEVTGDRVLFRGRMNEVINVGGVKVYPHTVEAAIMTVDGVQMAHVYGRDNPITGQVVAADVEILPGYDAAQTLAAIRAHLRATLSRYEQPRALQAVDYIERRNEKIVRSSS
jgi:acyl-CoA synthetase (AMP-forming)/AMP-acid ligase II